MGGVDLQDQVTALFPIKRCTVKGVERIFFYIAGYVHFQLLPFASQDNWQEKDRLL
jgi:hypothetical protein